MGNNTEKLMFLEFQKKRDVNIRNEIVNKYLYLAEIISKKFTNRGIDYEDLYQIASVALINAAERFDPEKGVKFVSFATPTIVGEIKRFFRDKASVVRIPRRIYEEYKKVNDAREDLTQKLERPPRIDEIAKHLDMSEETIIEIIESNNVHSIQSFDQNVYKDENFEFHETIGEKDLTFEKVENRDFLIKSLDRFNETEKDFINMRYFNSKTQKDIAEKFGVSQMYVSRLEKKVLDKFRTILKK